MLNLDTHILVHALQGNLLRSERNILEKDSWGISAIVLWELAKLSQHKRITLDLTATGFTRALSRIHIWPLNLAVCRKIQELDFESDPADEMIAATSLVHNVPLVTRDKKILCSRLVPFPNSFTK